MKKNCTKRMILLAFGSVSSLLTGVDIVILNKTPNALWVEAAGINVDTETPDLVDSPRETVHINSTYVTRIKVTDAVTGARDVWTGNSDGMGVAWQVSPCDKPCRSHKKNKNRKRQPCPAGICIQQVDLPE